jgi:acid phosphatase
LENRVLFAGGLPRPDHVVVVVEENHTYDQILGPVVPQPALWSVSLPSPLTEDPYLRKLAARSASMTNVQSVGRANATTYQSIISGLNPTPPDHPVPPAPFHSPNLASELIASGLSFGGYAESLPHVGYRGGNVGGYNRQHNPWVDLANVPASDNLPFSAFPSDYSKLPTVSYVVPNLYNDMHSDNVSRADQWLKDNISGYAKWAMSHNSMLVVIWDEGFGTSNHIPTLFYGPMVEAGNYSEPVSQANVLRTLEDMYGVAPTGRSVNATPITDIFEKPEAAGTGEPVGAKRTTPRPGSISGTVSLTGADGMSAVSGPLAGWQIFLDSDNDGIYQAGDPVGTTNHNGRYAFHNLSPGAYTARLIQKPGYASADAMTSARPLTLKAGGHLSNVGFSEIQIR